jgi:hypothetical protein
MGSFYRNDKYTTKEVRKRMALVGRFMPLRHHLIA